MHIIQQQNESLIVADTRPDGSVRVNFYELREYMELTALEFESLIELRALHTAKPETVTERLMRAYAEAGAPITWHEAQGRLHDASLPLGRPTQRRSSNGA